MEEACKKKRALVETVSMGMACLGHRSFWK